LLSLKINLYKFNSNQFTLREHLTGWVGFNNLNIDHKIVVVAEQMVAVVGITATGYVDLGCCSGTSTVDESNSFAFATIKVVPNRTKSACFHSGASSN
jgi:hypothetical protein